MKPRSFLFCACIALTGCATTISAPPLDDKDVATVTFIRERAEPTAWNLGVQIDGKEQASLSNRSSVTFKVKPGEHKFTLKWPFLAGQIDLTGDITFMPNVENYYLISSAIKLGGMDYRGITVNQSIGMIPISKNKADEIRAKLPH